MIPVFPLYIVPFPFQSLPLSIFEDRYRRMVEHCLKSGEGFTTGRIWRGREVGGNATPYRVGVQMAITDVQDESDLLQLQTVGIRRVYFEKFDSNFQPWLEAEVVPFEDRRPGTRDPESLLEVWSKYLRHIVGVSENTLTALTSSSLTSLPLSELTLAICPFVRLPYMNLQFLLESQDPDRRSDNLIYAMERALAERDGRPSPSPPGLPGA